MTTGDGIPTEEEVASTPSAAADSPRMTLYEPAQYDNPKHAEFTYITSRIKTIKVQITLGVRIIGRCHDVTNSNR
jgi:hypothetical protein